VISIVAGYSRSEEKRRDFEQDLGIPTVPDLQSLLNIPEIQGVILTVPNEQHLPVAMEVAKAKKHVYTEKPMQARWKKGWKSPDCRRIRNHCYGWA